MIRFLSKLLLRWSPRQRADALITGDREMSQEHAAEASDFDVTVDYLEQHKVVKLTARGVFDLAANNKLVSAALAASKRYGTDLILIDDRNVEIKMDYVKLYDLPEHNQMRGVSQNLRVALLYTPSRELDQMFKFYENRSHIMDFQHTVFTEEDKALRWLTGK